MPCWTTYFTVCTGWYKCKVGRKCICLCLDFECILCCACWLSAHTLQRVLCMCVLWASQLSYSCVMCPLCLIIYWLSCHTAGWLCSLQLVFHFSPHLACLNKTVSILKAFSFNHEVTPHEFMAAGGKCNQSLNVSEDSQLSRFWKLSHGKWTKEVHLPWLKFKTPEFQCQNLCVALDNTFTKWLSLLLTYKRI